MKRIFSSGNIDYEITLATYRFLIQKSRRVVLNFSIICFQLYIAACDRQMNIIDYGSC